MKDNQNSSSFACHSKKVDIISKLVPILSMPFLTKYDLALSLLGNFDAFCRLLIFIQNKLFEKSFRNTIRVSNSLDTDQSIFLV